MYVQLGLYIVLVSRQLVRNDFVIILVRSAMNETPIFAILQHIWCATHSSRR